MASKQTPHVGFVDGASGGVAAAAAAAACCCSSIRSTSACVVPTSGLPASSLRRFGATRAGGMTRVTFDETICTSSSGGDPVRSMAASTSGSSLLGMFRTQPRVISTVSTAISSEIPAAGLDPPARPRLGGESLSTTSCRVTRDGLGCDPFGRLASPTTPFASPPAISPLAVAVDSLRALSCWSVNSPAPFSPSSRAASRSFPSRSRFRPVSNDHRLFCRPELEEVGGFIAGLFKKGPIGMA
mmetsp:Transcript_15990/g.45790  ORF Transcript_15990/g.45790 Transcript_15990/m.45790 type:complete len:242 (-) Transcript_15990:77-802(-)